MPPSRQRPNDPHPFKVLLEDNHLLVVTKPVDLPTMGAEGDRASLVSLAKEYLKAKYAKPGNVYLGVVSRLDSLVSGVIVLARTSKAASRLTEQFRSRTVEKVYWAMVEGGVRPRDGTLEDWLWHDDSAQRVRVCDPAHQGAKQARLAYRVLRRVGTGSLVEVRLETGRKHQIRVQWAVRDMPIWGDRKYGSRQGFPSGIALHSRLIRFEHPVTKEQIELTAQLPAAWSRAGIAEDTVQ